MSGRARKRKSGQTMIFLIMLLTILALVALWNFDLHKIVYVKSLSQNAGDAAALAGARWQAITLNLIGDLNLMQAVALTQGDTNTATGINDLQARLCFVGPMVGLMAAQQAAKNNGIFNNARFTERMRTNAFKVRYDYPALGPDGTMLFQEPYSNCWQEYADMIDVVADNGVAAAPDNARLYNDITGTHMLLNPDFYDAIAGELWCWFYHNAYDLLLNYDGYEDWPPLPEELPQKEPINCEYFGLGLAKRHFVLDTEQANLMGALSSNTVGGVTSVWYCYDGDGWGPWDSMSPVGDAQFPVTGLIKPQYDYAGADAAVRVLAEASRLTPRPVTVSNSATAGATSPLSSRITWTAAAKPFGYLNEDERPNAFEVVLPAFRDIRLIPVDASSAPANGAFDLDWRDHIEGHLEDYLKSGPSALVEGCWYCQQLRTWENPIFRRTGIDWLAANSGRCRTYSGGGGGRQHGGGARRGH